MFPKDTIITKKNARVKIVMIDENIINISPKSKITIEKYEYEPSKDKKEVLLNVIFGKIRSKIKQKYNGKSSKYEVKTKTTVAGVRGTDFLLTYDHQTKQTTIITFEGQVQFGRLGLNGGVNSKVLVSVGQMSSSITGAAPTKPVRIPKSELKQINRQTQLNEPDQASVNDSMLKRRDAHIEEEPRLNAKRVRNRHSRDPASCEGKRCDSIILPPPPMAPTTGSGLYINQPNTICSSQLCENFKTNLNIVIE